MGMFSAMGASIGAIGQGIAAKKGMDAQRQTMNDAAARAQGTLTAGRNEARSDFSPFMSAGATAAGNATNLIGASGNIAAPEMSQPFNFQQWNDPSANYALQQSNATLQNSALAKGGMGGGLARALSENATNMANQNYQNAFKNYTTNAEQVFNQGQTRYKDINEQEQQKIANTQNLANMGLTATGNYGGLAAKYNEGIAGNQYQLGTDQAHITSSGYKDMGGAFNTANTQAGSAVDQSPWGRVMNLGGK